MSVPRMSYTGGGGRPGDLGGYLPGGSTGGSGNPGIDAVSGLNKQLEDLLKGLQAPPDLTQYDPTKLYQNAASAMQQSHNQMMMDNQQAAKLMQPGRYDQLEQRLLQSQQQRQPPSRATIMFGYQ